MLAGLLQQQETHSRTRHALYTGRNYGTLRLLNPTWRMCKAVCTRFLEGKLRFETGRGLRSRSRHHHRLERCSPVRQPDRSDLVTQYMTFTREEQKKAGVVVKQAPAVLPNHLHIIVSPLRVRLQCTSDPYIRVVLARGLALFTVAFETPKRGNELSRTLIQRILRLPDLSGFFFNFQWGKTMKDGADHHISVPYNHECLATCPVTAVDQLIAVGSALGWDMTRGYLFPSISRDAEGGASICGKASMSAAEMTHALKSHARAAGEKADFSIHYFRSGGGTHKGLERGGPLLHHGAGLLEEAQ